MKKMTTFNLLNEFSDKIENIVICYKRGVLTSGECFRGILEIHLEYERLISTSEKYFINKNSLIVAINGITSSVIRIL